MTMGGQPDGLVPIEPVLIMDCFMTGVTSVAFFGGLVRVTLHCDRPGADGALERIIICRLVMTEADYAASTGVCFGAAQSHRPFPELEYRASH